MVDCVATHTLSWWLYPLKTKFPSLGIEGLLKGSSHKGHCGQCFKGTSQWCLSQSMDYPPWCLRTDLGLQPVRERDFLKNCPCMSCSRARRKSVAEQLILAMAPKFHPRALITVGIRAADKLWVISLGLELQVLWLRFSNVLSAASWIVKIRYPGKDREKDSVCKKIVSRVWLKQACANVPLQHSECLKVVFSSLIS